MLLLQTLLYPVASMRVDPADHMAPDPVIFVVSLGLVSLLGAHSKS